MPVKIGRFQPTTMERVEELRRGKARRAGDPGMAELLDAVEAGEPQEVPVEGEQRPKGMRIAIARAANRRGLAVEMFESSDAQGNPVVVVVKREQAPEQQRAAHARSEGNGRRRGRGKRQTEVQATNNYDEPRDADGLSETME